VLDMALSKQMLALMERVERAGGSVDRAALTRKFNFTLAGIVDAGVDYKVFVQLCVLVQKIVQQQDFKCDLTGIVVFPIILGSSGFKRDDFITYKRKESAYFVGRNIDHNTWARARRPKRIKLAVENLKTSVQSIPEKHLSIEKKTQITGMIDAAAEDIAVNAW
jgi:hypothetical protein